MSETLVAMATAVALACLPAAALADDIPKVTAPTTPPDLILNCLDKLTSTTSVEVWNSGVVRERTSIDSATFAARVTITRIDILADRTRYPSGFSERHKVIDRVTGDMRFEVRFVDADGEPAIPPPEVKPDIVRISHCEIKKKQS